MKYKKDIRLSAEAGSISEAVCNLMHRIHDGLGEILQYDHDTGLMTYCLDCCRRYDGSVRPALDYGTWGVMLDNGCSFDIAMPYPIADNGQQKEVDMISPRNKHELISELNQFGGCPIEFDPKAKVFVSRSASTIVHASDTYARWSDYMRPVSCILQACDHLKIPKPDTKVTNDILADIEAVVKGYQYSCHFIDCPISEIYEAEPDDKFGSCMASSPASWFEIYDRLQNHGLLGMIRIMRGDVHAGRALVWYGSNPDDIYLDRIYTDTSCGVKIPAALAAIKEFCAEHNIVKCVHPHTPNDIGLEYRNLRISVPFDMTYLDYFPYVDSMRYYFSDGCLRNRDTANGAHVVIKMDRTDGTAEIEDDEDYVTLENGDRTHVDDATYVERHGEWYYNHECVHTHDDEYELRDDCSELCVDFYGRNVWAHDSNCTFIDELDETYHNDDIVELGDGSGEYWPTHLAVATPDGFYWKPTDDGIVEVDGVWVYWSDTQTQETATADEPVQI